MAPGRLTYTRFIAAPRQRVWEALSDPVATRAYFHDTAFELAPAAGEPFRTIMSDGSVAVEGEIREVVAPSRFGHTWGIRYDDDLAKEDAGLVTWELAEAGDGITRLSLTHSELGRSPRTVAHVRDGWEWVLDSLKSYLETGNGLPPSTSPGESEEITDAGSHRLAAMAANNAAWDVLDSDGDAGEALSAAYASLFHWRLAEGYQQVNEARAQYLLAKTWLAMGDGDRAMLHAYAALAACKEAGAEDFDLAFAHEARARALAKLGRTKDAAAAWAAARAVPIADDDDRAVVEAEFNKD